VTVVETSSGLLDDVARAPAVLATGVAAVQDIR
jgi:hypothetical protein